MSRLNSLTVDEQEDVGEVRARVTRAVQASLLHRLQAQRAEALLALLDLGAQLRDDTPHGLAVELAHDAADVRRALQRPEQPAAEIDRVEACLGRRVAVDQGSGERAEHGRLAGARGTDDGEVAARAGQVDRERLRALLARAVDAAERRAQAAARAALPPRRLGEHVVERERLGQRRDPDLMHRRAVAVAVGVGGEPADEDVEVGARGRRRRAVAGRGHGGQAEHGPRASNARTLGGGSPAATSSPPAAGEVTSAARNCSYVLVSTFR